MSAAESALRSSFRRGFFARVYVHALALLLFTTLAFGGLARLLMPSAPPRDTTTFVPWVISRAAEVRGDRVRLQAELDGLKKMLNLTVTLYDASGTVLGSNVDPPQAPASPAELESSGSRSPAAMRIVTTFRENGNDHGYAIVAFAPGPEDMVARLAVLFSALLIVIAAASIPLARSVVSPIEKLAATARSFGRGDMTARARVARTDEIGELARTFDDMADRVAELLRSEKELLANVSHELRTPLARIRVVVELASEVDAARARRYLSEIAEDLTEIERLVDDVITAARLDLGDGKARSSTPPLRLEPTDAAALIEKVTTRFRGTHPARRLDVEVGRLPAMVADEAMLRRVVENLVDNARKYSDAGSTIRVKATREGDTVCVEISDEGIGIASADLGAVFTPFFRTDRSRARGTGGVGLGLALSRRIVEAHGGRIELRSEIGVGTTVRLYVPASREA